MRSKICQKPLVTGDDDTSKSDIARVIPRVIADQKQALREMLAEAVRYTAQPEPDLPMKAKRDRPKKAA